MLVSGGLTPQRPDTTLQHSQLSATKAMEAGLQTTRLMVRVLGSPVILSVALWISMPRCFLLMHRQALADRPGRLDIWIMSKHIPYNTLS